MKKNNKYGFFSSLWPTSYRKQNLLIIALGVLFGFLTYNLDLKNTILLVKENHSLLKELYDAEHAGIAINEYKKQQNYLSRIITASSKDSGITQEEILEIINKYKQSFGLKLVEFPKPESYEKDNYGIKVYKIVLKGRFSDLLKTIFALEKIEKPGHIISISFNKITDYSLKKNYLTSTIYLQIVRLNEKS